MTSEGDRMKWKSGTSTEHVHDERGQGGSAGGLGGLGSVMGAGGMGSLGKGGGVVGLIVVLFARASSEGKR